MSALSDYLEAAFLDHLLNGVTLSSPTVYVALYTDDPTDADVGTEVSGNGYARARVYPNGGGSPAFALAVTDGDGKMVANADDVEFPEATAPWGTITHFGLRDAETGGNLLYHGALDEAQVIGTGGQLTAGAGDLKVRLQ